MKVIVLFFSKNFGLWDKNWVKKDGVGFLQSRRHKHRLKFLMELLDGL
ncbi:MAG: hypothetical protein PHX34_02955 [Candidatus Shapirobacteria bacterium]|nr:hypothetical protein [Candidatus Shapirobacteria bacterium]